MKTSRGLRSAFVTGATGLLGNNLVRELVARGVSVKALARSMSKGQQQFAGVEDVELVLGDMADVPAFSDALQGCDAVFHTAAFFRDNFKGGSHWEELKRINVDGTQQLIEQAYRAGVRRFIQTSSIAVLNGEPGAPIDETCLRDLADAEDDYYRSKILADQVVLDFLATHPDMHASFVLPGWMWGPADIGPTSSGQFVNDVVLGKLPGLLPGSFSVVDARDVARAQISAAENGQRGERYLAAGRHMTMQELVPLVGKIAGIKTPTRNLPFPLLYLLAAAQELYARISGKPILLSLATVRLMRKEAGRSHFNHAKSEQQLQLKFRPIEQTIADTVAWYRGNDWLPGVPTQ
ncbi:SDR family oxidoreductase [Roseateles sp. DAIF2]|uniref:SDR family oxidoreductase n=1 Tax=Roseateles sp. DAIF2 TaxID=2714952 RepID=UPI0018A2F9C2|nr:SDR family oxidoreductase [Roseateles sp. DAIF2]QPF73909.1 SDR family oxidoreductase [Roseateles sp. DAIF2]